MIGAAFQYSLDVEVVPPHEPADGDMGESVPGI